MRKGGERAAACAAAWPALLCSARVAVSGQLTQAASEGHLPAGRVAARGRGAAPYLTRAGAWFCPPRLACAALCPSFLVGPRLRLSFHALVRLAD